jgi:hypothetical protein
MALGVADRVWTVGDLLDAALATQPIDPVVTAPDRRKRFTVIDGGRSNDKEMGGEAAASPSLSSILARLGYAT